jgi:hypothetical protein
VGTSSSYSQSRSQVDRTQRKRGQQLGTDSGVSVGKKTSISYGGSTILPPASQYSHPRTIFLTTAWMSSAFMVSCLCELAGHSGCGPNPGIMCGCTSGEYGSASFRSLRRRASRCCFSSPLRPSTPMPMVRRTRSYKPRAADFVGLMQHAKNTSSSFSNSPKCSLQLLQLGAVHRWTSSGVVSGYQELGNT